jgi:hypothetical protein
MPTATKSHAIARHRRVVLEMALTDVASLMYLLRVVRGALSIFAR